MVEAIEKKWEKDIDDLFIENNAKAVGMIEKNWRDYLEFFKVYFKPNIDKDNYKTFLLDIGCGPGFVLKELLKYGFKISAVDFSIKVIEFAKKEVEGIDFKHSTVYQMPFSNEKFNIITCLGVFQTITDPDAALIEISRVLKKGGLLVIRTLNSLSFSGIKTKKQNPKFSFYNPFILKKKLEKMSFVVKNPKGIYFFPKRLRFLTDFIVKARLYKLFNFLFFPIFAFFAHSFYIEAVKK